MVMVRKMEEVIQMFRRRKRNSLILFILLISWGMFGFLIWRKSGKLSGIQGGNIL